MSLSTRHAIVGLAIGLHTSAFAVGQTAPPAGPVPPAQAAGPQSTANGAPQAVAPQAPQPPAGFALNVLQQAYLDQVLQTWQVESGKINTFKCTFERWEYNAAFGPGPDIPLNKDKGELSFQKPDKGSFQISEIKRWQATPVPAGQQPPTPAQGDWVVQKDAVGEHWVCDGKSVFEYRHDRKQLVERPIPPELQGQAIVDGPLPFLFGADANKLKARYWMRIEEQPDPNQIWLTALPKYQAQAANFRGVRVILDREKLLPIAMQVFLPDGSRHEYMFDIAKATINSPFARLQSLFERPRMWPGWTRVVEQIPVEQAAQPVQPPR